jgi:hypothetical protein
VELSAIARVTAGQPEGGTHKFEVHRVRCNRRTRKADKMRQAIQRDAAPAESSMIWQIDGRVEREPARVIGDRYRVLRFDETVSRELFAHLGSQILAFRVGVVAELVHPRIPDILQVLLVCHGPIGGLQSDDSSNRADSGLKTFQGVGSRGEHAGNIHYSVRANGGFELFRLRIRNGVERRHGTDGGGRLQFVCDRYCVWLFDCRIAGIRLK